MSYDGALTGYVTTLYFKKGCLTNGMTCSVF